MMDRFTELLQTFDITVEATWHDVCCHAYAYAFG